MRLHLIHIRNAKDGNILQRVKLPVHIKNITGIICFTTKQQPETVNGKVSYLLNNKPILTDERVYNENPAHSWNITSDPATLKKHSQIVQAKVEPNSYLTIRYLEDYNSDNLQYDIKIILQF